MKEKYYRIMVIFLASYLFIRLRILTDVIYIALSHLIVQNVAEKKTHTHTYIHICTM